MVHLGCIIYKKDGNGQEYLVEISLHVTTQPAGAGGVLKMVKPFLEHPHSRKTEKLRLHDDSEF